MDPEELQRLTEFLKVRLNAAAELKPGKPGNVDDPDDQAEAELWIDGAPKGWVRRDDEDPEDVSYSVGFSFKTENALNAAEDRLRELLNPAITLRERKSLGRTQIDDSVEIYVGPEFMGLLYRDAGRGGLTDYTVEIQVLRDDLEDEEV